MLLNCVFVIGADEDYLSGPYYIVFTAGMTEAVFNITVNDNDILEETETFNVVINSSSLPSMVTIGELGEAVVTILDNDGEVLSNRKTLTPCRGCLYAVGTPYKCHAFTQFCCCITVVNV